MDVKEASARYLPQRNLTSPVGYKQTEVGIIPEDWDVSSLGSLISSLEAGVSVNSVERDKDIYAHDESVLKTSCVFGGQFLPEEKKKIVPRDINRAKGNPRKDSIIISRMNTPALVGESGYVERDYPSLFLPDRLWMTRHVVQEPPCVRWLAYLLAYRFFNRVIKESATGTSGSMKNISKGALLAAQVPLPTKPEQEAIAEVLSDADALIESLEQLLAKKRHLKQGAMQQLLTGKKRLPGFSGEWEVKRLGELGSFLKGSGVRKDESLSGDLACIRYGEIYTKHNDYIKVFHSWISPEVAATAKRLKQGDLLFAGSGETKEEIGKCVAFIDDTDAYAGGDIVILRPENSNSTFLGYYLNTSPINQQKASRGQGDAVVHISSAALSSIEITIPKVEEQTAIATILSDMDTDLAAMEAMLAKARDLKQGMMQELLTGRVRLV